MKKILTFTLICLALVCAMAFAEEAAPEAGTEAAETAAVVRSPYLDIAFSCLEGAPLDTKALEEVVAQRFKGAVLALNQRVFALGCEAAKEAVK